MEGGQTKWPGMDEQGHCAPGNWRMMSSSSFPGRLAMVPPSQAQPLSTIPTSGGHWEVHTCISEFLPPGEAPGSLHVKAAPGNAG